MSSHNILTLVGLKQKQVISANSTFDFSAIRIGSSNLQISETAGAFDFNAVNITNVGTVDGRDVSADGTALDNHVANTSNPHSVTKTQVGLANVDNVQQLPMSYLDTDTTLAANSDLKVPSQKAIKSYADTADALKVSKSGDTMSGNLAMGNNKVTGLANGTAATDATNLGQLQAYAAGALWLNPIQDPDLIDDSLSTPPGSPVVGDVYIAGASATGAWAGLDGHAFYHNGTSWVDLLGRAVIVGDRFGVSIESATAGAGGLAGQNNKIAQITTATPGSIAYTFTTPATPQAVYVNNDDSSHFGHSYTYNGTDWIEFGGPGATNAGIGLAWDGNTLNVNLGAGIVQLPTDEVGVDVHTAGGLMTTVDNSTSSTVTGSQLAVKLDGSTLAKSSSGVKVAAGGITNTEVGAAAAIDLSKLAAVTANRALASNASGVIVPSSVTDTELGYLSGVTSAIQTQLNTKASTTYVDANGGATLILTAGGTSTLTSSSPRFMALTGTLTQTVVLPSNASLPVGELFVVRNASTQNITVQNSSLATSWVIPANFVAEFRVRDNSEAWFALWSPVVDFGATFIGAGGYKISNAADPVAAQDVVTKNYGDTNYVVTASNGVKKVSGVIQRDDALTFTNDNAGAITVGQIVYIKSNGNVDKALASTISSDAELGIVEDASIATTASGKIIVRRGAIVSGFSGLTPGKKQYVSRSTAGALTESLTGFVAGEQVYSVGRAISATQISYNPMFEFEF